MSSRINSSLRDSNNTSHSIKREEGRRTAQELFGSDITAGACKDKLLEEYDAYLMRLPSKPRGIKPNNSD